MLVGIPHLSWFWYWTQLLTVPFSFSPDSDGDLFNVSWKACKDSRDCSSNLNLATHWLVHNLMWTNHTLARWEMHTAKVINSCILTKLLENCQWYHNEKSSYMLVQRMSVWYVFTLEQWLKISTYTYNCWFCFSMQECLARRHLCCVQIHKMYRIK